jgi:hypothetical protein
MDMADIAGSCAVGQPDGDLLGSASDYVIN